MAIKSDSIRDAIIKQNDPIASEIANSKIV